MKGAREPEAPDSTRTSPGNVPTESYGQSVGGALPAPLSHGGKISRFLGSPQGIMILVPLLVLVLGFTLTVVGQLALSSMSRHMAQQRFVSRTSSVGLRLEHTLAQAEPILDELSRVARATSIADTLPAGSEVSPTLRQTALEMRDLLIGRSATTQLYIAYPNGVFLSADPKEDRTVLFQVTMQKSSVSYRVEKQTLVQERKGPSEYDPRVRAWYRAATEEKQRIWSKPYAFYSTQHTGVTRAHALYFDAEKTRLQAVVGIDFNVDALSAFMAAGEQAEDSISSVAFNSDGVVLAYPDGAARLKALQNKGQVPTHSLLGDRALSALIAHTMTQKFLPLRSDLLRYKVGDAWMLASVRKVGGAAPDWYVATFSTEKSVLQELYDHRERSLVIGLLSLLVASIFAWFLAKKLLYAREVASLAQQEVLAARDRIRDLGSYRLESLIGHGGMGEVWRASHRLLARQAAIKLIKKGASSGPQREQHRKRFQREAQAIAGLRSRNTVALFDYGVTPDDTLFYVMDLLDGIDLHTLVNKHGTQPPERVRNILLQATNSLREAHAAGLVHRDIKPANLFLCREAGDVDVLKVLDFGLVFRTEGSDAKGEDAESRDERTTTDLGESLETVAPPPLEEGRITHVDNQLGTPAFMSPEQALGEDTDGRADLYSLACVAWWLLTGHPPFKAETSMALMIKHIEEPLPSLTEQCPAPLLPAFSELIEKCLAKSADARPQSAVELAESLSVLGVVSDDWDQARAEAWWKAALPQSTRFPQTQSTPALRGAEVLRPNKAS